MYFRFKKICIHLLDSTAGFVSARLCQMFHAATAVYAAAAAAPSVEGLAAGISAAASGDAVSSAVSASAAAAGAAAAVGAAGLCVPSDGDGGGAAAEFAAWTAGEALRTARAARPHSRWSDGVADGLWRVLLDPEVGPEVAPARTLQRCLFEFLPEASVLLFFFTLTAGCGWSLVAVCCCSFIVGRCVGVVVACLGTFACVRVYR
jgi:hypothetical protein